MIDYSTLVLLNLVVGLLIGLAKMTAALEQAKQLLGTGSRKLLQSLTYCYLSPICTLDLLQVSRRVEFRAFLRFLSNALSAPIDRFSPQIINAPQKSSSKIRENSPSFPYIALIPSPFPASPDALEEPFRLSPTVRFP